MIYSRRFIRRWPWLGHRTLAEVAETERLLAERARGEPYYGNNTKRLEVLLIKRDRYNPPPITEPESAA